MPLIKDMKDFLRGNPKLKAPGYKEYITQDVLLDRISELKRISVDPIYFAEKYFYIVTTDGGKELISVYPKQQEMIKAMCERSRTIVLSARQTGKSTSYTIFCLWYCIINKDKSILICANKFGTAKDILQRIRMAYEDLPNWLKPGIVEWNRGSIVFDNGCKISAEATSGNSGRGSSINCLVVDEFAFLKPGIESEFLQSVFPVVSSSKTSKIIIVSTPHGMANEFYRIWNRSTLDLENEMADEKFRWFPVKVDWYEVPGRDENWYKQQLESFGGNKQRFAQEYGCSFLGSSETLINSVKINEYKENFQKDHIKGDYVQLHKEFKNTTIKMFHRPERYHSYVIGADPSLGIDSDFQAMSVWDITNTFKIKQVATFYENNVQPKIFAYILAKTGKIYGDAAIAIENNGCSQVVLDALINDYEYDNIVHEGGNPKTNIGIHSMNSRKAEACLNFKLLVEDKTRTIEINDGRLLAEMEKFERMSRIGKESSYGAADGHDDFMMCAIWGLYVLKTSILERFYDIKKFILNSLGEQIPLYVLPYGHEYEDENQYDIANKINDMDKKLFNYESEFERKQNNLKSEIDSSEIDEFIKENRLNVVGANHDQEDHDDDAFRRPKSKEEQEDFGFSFF